LGFGAKPEQGKWREQGREEGGSQDEEKERSDERKAEVTRSKVAAARVGFPFLVRTRESRSPTLPRV
jgi:hypothetical protein